MFILAWFDCGLVVRNRVFRRIFLSAQDLGKNPVSLILVVGEWPETGFFAEYLWAPRIWKKPGFFDFDCGFGGQKPGFSQDICERPGFGEKPGFFDFDCGWVARNRVFRRIFVSAQDLGKNPVSLILIVREWPETGFFLEISLLSIKIVKTRFLRFCATNLILP